MINYPFNRIALQNGSIFYLFTIYTLSILFHFKTSHQKVNEFRITILSSNEIHSSLTIDRFSQSWRPESTHNRGTYIPLSSIDPKKEQEKTGRTPCSTAFTCIVSSSRPQNEKYRSFLVKSGWRERGRASASVASPTGESLGVKMHPGMGVSAGDRRENTVMQARNGVCDKIENYISDLGQW